MVKVEVRTRGGELALVAGGRVLRYPAVWLRDNCPCAECADPHSGQKLHDVDGFAAAVARQDADPAAFGTLTRNTCRYEYQDSGNVLRTSQPLIQLSPRGQVRGVRFNNRSARPVRLPHDEVAPFYAACRRWAELLARTAYSVTGGRHLQGCYSDLDGLASTLAMLGRET